MESPQPTSPSPATRVAVIGAGPSGLMAAEALTESGFSVDIYDAMPSLGRKFLMAGKSGLNITHTEKLDKFLSRYEGDNGRVATMVKDCTPHDIIGWMQGLDIDAFASPTGRVFPSMMKASPLLRAWITRLQDHGVSVHTRHRWSGWDAQGQLVFEAPVGTVLAAPTATVLALGGASWKRLGSDGAWTEHLASRGLEITPFSPSNCGFTADWTDLLVNKFAGAPVKATRLSVIVNGKAETSRAEFVITERGVESGAIYSLSAPLRRELAANGTATVMVDLLPDVSETALVKRLATNRGKQSLTNHLRKSVRLTGVKLGLLYELGNKDEFADPRSLARNIKSLKLKLTGMAPMDEAISTAGGVAWNELDERLMLSAFPGVFCAGEMIDWDAPTGGYLITGCLATGKTAGLGAADWIAAQNVD